MCDPLEPVTGAGGAPPDRNRAGCESWSQAEEADMPASFPIPKWWYRLAEDNRNPQRDVRVTLL